MRGVERHRDHICSRGHGAKERWARRVGARRGTLIKPSTTSGGGRHLLEVARRDASQASTWPSWISNQLTIRHTRFYFLRVLVLRFVRFVRFVWVYLLLRRPPIAGVPPLACFSIASFSNSFISSLVATFNKSLDTVAPL